MTRISLNGNRSNNRFEEQQQKKEIIANNVPVIDQNKTKTPLPPSPKNLEKPE